MAAVPKSISETPVAIGVEPCLISMPYRAVVFHTINQHKVPLYVIAGSEGAPQSAKNALKTAFEKHGGVCFYCKQPVTKADFTIDHADPLSLAGDDNLQNLLIAHRACNLGKGNRSIEQFSPQAGREWLSAVCAQLQHRLAQIG